MTIPTQPLPTLGNPNTTEDPKIRSALTELQAILTAGVDNTNLAASLLALLGVNGGATVGRGKCITPGEDTYAAMAYGLMPTPDRVSSVVLPTDGLIAVGYTSLWSASGGAAAHRAAIFIGGNQLKVQGYNAVNTGTPATQAAAVGSGAGTNYSIMGSTAFGLVGTAVAADPNSVSAVTTGQVVGMAQYTTGPTQALDDVASNFNATPTMGGVCYIFAAAGTYDVSIKFKVTTGTTKVKERKLWVWTMGF